MLPRLRERLHGMPYPSLASTNSGTPVVLPDAAGSPGPVDCVDALPSDGALYRGIPFVGGNGPVVVQGARAAAAGHPQTTQIAVDATFDSLVFLHACSTNAPRTPWKPLVRIAEYTIVFEDGTTELVPVEYGGNIAPINRRHAQPMTSPIYRHQGYIGTYLADAAIRTKSPRGEDVTLYAYEWLNPHSGRRITSVRLSATDAAGDCMVIVAALTGIAATP
jgi:hypothetical protein